MKQVIMTPSGRDFKGAKTDAIVWNREDLERGVVLIPPGCANKTTERLFAFASGSYDLAKAMQNDEAEDLSVDPNDFLSARPIGFDGIVERFYAERVKTKINLAAISWLVSNLMLEKALTDNPRYVCVRDKSGNPRNVPVTPVQHLGAAYFRLSNGLTSTLTIMSRAPGRRVLDLCLEREGFPTGLNSFLGVPEPVFMEAVAACMWDSLYATFPTDTRFMFTDPHKRNVIVDENDIKVSIVDVNGLSFPLHKVLGSDALEDLEFTDKVRV